MDISTMRRGLLALPVLALLVLGGCKFETSYAGDNGFMCETDDDCLAGFFCSNFAAGSGEGSGTETLGRCVDEDEGGEGQCSDADGDGAFVGLDCPAGRLVDCDDTDNSVNPTAVEECDGIDNNCDGVTDEDQPPLPCPLQIGICAGAQRECVDGGYVDCGEAGLYGPLYQQVETLCDGVDNDCDGGEPDEQCECDPLVEEAFHCGRDTGPCTRGVELCQADGSRSECIVAQMERQCADGLSCTFDSDCVDASACVAVECETSDDCGDGGICTQETVLAREDPFDDCVDDTDVECDRTVCRIPFAGDACESDTDCSGGQFCSEGLCREPNVTPLEDGELCNGIDDNCDGSIDNDATRNAICGPCPYNMAFLFITRPDGNPDFICVDWYEASRPDATATNVGSNELYTLPRAGVLPWTGLNPDQADLICNGAPLRDIIVTSTVAIAVKRLCKTYEWRQGCGGTTGTAEEFDYPYSTDRDSDVYIEGACVDASTGASSPAVTGSAPECCRVVSRTPEGEETVICDMSGNVAEYVVDASSNPLLAGGSYLDSDPATLSCGDGVSYQPVPGDAADHPEIGFRCCTPRQ